MVSVGDIQVHALTSITGGQTNIRRMKQMVTENKPVYERHMGGMRQDHCQTWLTMLILNDRRIYHGKSQYADKFGRMK